MYNPFTGYTITDDWDDHIARGSLGGIDYAMPVGTPLPAPEDGVVSYIPNNGTGGHTAVITHANGTQTVYMHLSSFAFANNTGVHAGEPVGKSGGEKDAPGAGSSEGPHLHAHQNENGVRVPPFNGITTGAGFGDAVYRKEEEMQDIRIINDGKASYLVRPGLPKAVHIKEPYEQTALMKVLSAAPGTIVMLGNLPNVQAVERYMALMALPAKTTNPAGKSVEIERHNARASYGIEHAPTDEA